MQTNNNRTAAQILADADKNGWTEVKDGIYLESQANMIAEQKTWDDEDMGKQLDFTTAPFYLTTNDGYIYEVHNPDHLLEQIANQADEEAEIAAILRDD